MALKLLEEATMKVKDLIERLKEFDENLRVIDDYMLDIEEVKETTWVDSNYPYDRADEVVIMII